MWDLSTQALERLAFAGEICGRASDAPSTARSHDKERAGRYAAQSESIGLGIRVLASGLGICFDGSVDARRRDGLRGTGGVDSEGFGDCQAQRSGDGGRAGLRR